MAVSGFEMRTISGPTFFAFPWSYQKSMTWIKATLKQNPETVFDDDF